MRKPGYVGTCPGQIFPVNDLTQQSLCPAGTLMTFAKNAYPTKENPSEPLLTHASANQEMQQKIRDFERGNFAVLSHPEIIEVIAHHIFNLYNTGDMRYALILLENLGEWSRSDSVEYRERSLMALSLITDKVLQEDNEDFLEALASLFIRWLKHETEYLTGFEHICVQLRRLIKKMLHLGLWHQSEDLIVILSKISNGEIKKGKLLTRVIAQTHSSLAETTCLHKLTHSYMDGDSDKRVVAGKLLIHFGKKAIFYLVYTLCNSPDKTQRLHLIDLIPSAGSSVIPVLTSRLQKQPPWYIVRNIIIILSKFEDPSLFPLVKPFMGHDDIRVQREVIACIGKMNGSRMIPRLVNAIKVCNQRLKPQIIRMLAPLPDGNDDAALAAASQDRCLLDQGLKDEIISDISCQLSERPSKEAAEPPERIIHEQGNGVNGAPATKSPLPFLPRHLLLRSDLYCGFSKEETSAFTSTLSYRVFKQGETLVAHGDIHSSLFFIDSGEVELLFPPGYGELSVRRLRQGDVFGNDIFMTGSEWDVTLVACCETEVYMFDQENLLKMRLSLPDMTTKVLDYCKQLDVLPGLLRMMETGRSQEDSPVHIVFTGNGGEYIADVEMIAVSAFGCCFCLYLPRGFSHSLFADKPLSFFFEKDEAKHQAREGLIVGLRFIAQENCRLYIYAQYAQQCSADRFDCTRIGLH
jgi:CRP-like cAMP-binding protein